MNPFRAHRYTSALTCFGLPLLAVAHGPDPARGEQSGHARGLVAVGDRATGIIALGTVARGVVALGSASVGVIAIGGAALGIVAVGGAAGGVAAVGGMALGGWTFGGTSLGLVEAAGGTVVPWRQWIGL